MHWRTQDMVARHGPRALMGASLLAVLWLVLHGPAATVPGYAEVAPVRLSSLEPGIVASVHASPGDVVAAGDVIAVLDDSVVLGNIRVLEAEIERHDAARELVADGALAALREAQASREETAAELRAARETLALAEQRLADRRRQVEKGLAALDDLIPLEAEVSELRGEVDLISGRLLREGETTEHARSRIDPAGDAPAPALMEQIRARAVVEEELALLRERQRGMTLRAPLDARVGVVNYHPGEVLPENAVFVELYPLETTAVVACVPEQFGDVVQAGGVAELWPASGGPERSGTVIDVVGLVAEAPERCKQRPNELGWVRPVRIEVDGEALVPGQRFDVAFQPPQGDETRGDDGSRATPGAAAGHASGASADLPSGGGVQ